MKCSIKGKDKIVIINIYGPHLLVFLVGVQKPWDPLQAAFVGPIKLNPFLLAEFNSNNRLLTYRNLGGQNAFTADSLMPLFFSFFHKSFASFPTRCCCSSSEFEFWCLLFSYFSKWSRPAGWKVHHQPCFFSFENVSIDCRNLLQI